MNRTKSIIAGFVIVGVGVVGMTAMMANKPLPPKKPPQVSSPLVEVILPEAQTVEFLVESHGVVQPRTETSLISEVSGVVTSVSDKFVSGGLFNQGEIILQIDPADYEVAVEQSKARLASEKAKYAQEEAKAEQARKEWDLTGRNRNNAPALALREPFILEAKANMQSAEADLKKAEQKLARTIIRAPYHGLVKSKNVDIGQYVSMGTNLGITFAIDYAEVRLPLTDQELAFINLPDWGQANLGQAKNNKNTPEVILKANYAGSEVSWTGQIVRMEGVIDSQSRVHYVVARITDPYSVLNTENINQLPPLKVGAFVTASIKGKKENNLIKLPRDVFKDLKQVLVSDKDNQLYLRELMVVRTEGDYVYISEGLDQGDRVVVTALESPVQGMKVRVLGEENEIKDELDKTNDTAIAKAE